MLVKMIREVDVLLALRVGRRCELRLWLVVHFWRDVQLGLAPFLRLFPVGRLLG